MDLSISELARELDHPVYRKKFLETLDTRLVSVDPLEQRTVGEMRTLLFKDKKPVSDVTYTIVLNLYFRNELRALLEKAGFTVEAEKGGWTDADATVDDVVIVFAARK